METQPIVAEEHAPELVGNEAATDAVGDGEGNGKSDAIEPSRPAVLDGLKPITPKEQRVLMPKPKAKGKAKAAAKKAAASSKTKRGKRKRDDDDEATEDFSNKRAKNEKALGKAAPKPACAPPLKRVRGKKADADSCPETLAAAAQTTAGGEKRRKTKRSAESTNEKTSKTKSSDSPGGPSGAASSSPNGASAPAHSEEDGGSRKQRQSRKSSAYHKAKKSALADGKSQEEAKAIAKQAT